MSFTSVTFLLFLPGVFLLHWAGRRRCWQNAVLLLASYLFYGWWDWRCLGLLWGSSLVDYFVGRGLERTHRASGRHLLLGISLTVNLGMLGVFKYLGFFADNLAVALATLGVEVNTSTLHLLLPIGISFYTFQTLSYTIEVYRGNFRPRRDLLSYLTYVAFFPQLVAGPIERAQRLLPQFEKVRSFEASQAAEGCRLLLWGFAKKLLLADNLARLVEAPYAAPETAGAAALFVATLAFAFQIYCDFSAYSDIAAGVGRLFGIELTRNFRCPYHAGSLREFWHRWHISFSSWLRDYVYIPLGGSRCPNPKLYGNLLITAAASGLWHGASWNFFVWGLFHGCMLILERILQAAGVWLPRSPDESTSPNGGRWRLWAHVLVTFGLVCVGWVFFRASTLTDACTVCIQLAGGVVQPQAWFGVLQSLWENRWLVLCVAGLLVAEGSGSGPWIPRFLNARSWIVRWMVYTVLVWLVLLFGTQRAAEFIYFQF